MNTFGEYTIAITEDYNHIIVPTDCLETTEEACYTLDKSYYLESFYGSKPFRMNSGENIYVHTKDKEVLGSSILGALDDLDNYREVNFDPKCFPLKVINNVTREFSILNSSISVGGSMCISADRDNPECIPGWSIELSKGASFSLRDMGHCLDIESEGDISSTVYLSQKLTGDFTNIKDIKIRFPSIALYDEVFSVNIFIKEEGGTFKKMSKAEDVYTICREYRSSPTLLISIRGFKENGDTISLKPIELL